MINDSFIILVFWNVEGLGVDEEEKIGHSQEWEKDNGGSYCPLNLSTITITITITLTPIVQSNKAKLMDVKDTII